MGFRRLDSRAVRCYTDGMELTMTAEETLAACGGEKKCGGEDVHYRYIIHGVAVLWRESRMQPLRARTVNGKFLRGGQAREIMNGSA